MTVRSPFSITVLGVLAAIACLTLVVGSRMLGAQGSAEIRVRNGALRGTLNARTGVRSFKGIPFAAPPTGALRWKEPQPVADWSGVRAATGFGARCMQLPIFGDMVFRSNGMSEDCLYLNVWSPATSAGARLPVLVYFYGGGYASGDGSEARYDGERMAQRGIVALTVNYRLSVFGFLAHPDLTRESPHHSSGNYALLDQVAALRWVRDNIAAFGGDPARVTIAGESAGSIAVSAVMATPLSKGLIAGAIGESGAMISPTLPPVQLAKGEEIGVTFAKSLGAESIAALRAIPAEQLLAKGGSIGRFPSTVDGYALPKAPVDIFEAGEQAHVPLLVGSNSAEGDWQAVLRDKSPTPENYRAAVTGLFGDRANEALQLYPATSTAEVYESARELASDRFISYSTWKWFDAHSRTGGRKTYYYLYAHPRPSDPPRAGETPPSVDASLPPAPRGAAHAVEIEYAMDNLDGATGTPWTADDRKVAATMSGYFANFVKTGDPNGPGLPMWPAATSGATVERMRIAVDSRVETDRRRARYLFLETIYRAP